MPIATPASVRGAEAKANPLAINAIKRSFFIYFPFLFVVLRGIEAPCQGFPSTLKNPRQPLCTESDDDGRAVATKEAKNGAVYRPDTSQRNSSLVSLVGNGWAIAWLRNIQSKRASDRLELVAE